MEKSLCSLDVAPSNMVVFTSSGAAWPLRLIELWSLQLLIITAEAVDEQHEGRVCWFVKCLENTSKLKSLVLMACSYST